MKTKIIVGLSLIALYACNNGTVAQESYKNPQLPIEHRVQNLLKFMTLEEKIAELRRLLHSCTADDKELAKKILEDVRNLRQS